VHQSSFLGYKGFLEINWVSNLNISQGTLTKKFTNARKSYFPWKLQTLQCWYRRTIARTYMYNTRNACPSRILPFCCTFYIFLILCFSSTPLPSFSKMLDLVLWGNVSHIILYRLVGPPYY
jgi:hypothetical protein